MRRPIDQPFVITTEFGVKDSYAKFGYHSGVDYAVPTGRQVFAPASGTLTNVVSPTGGNMVVIFDGKFYHRLMHNSSFSRGNGAVSEGQEVAKAGTTGLSTGPHVHWDINKEGTYPTSFAAFIPPADWLAGKYVTQVPQGGANVFNTIEEVKEAYLQMRGVVGTDAEMRGWIGQSKQRWIQMSKAETDSTRKQLADVRAALDKLQKQPPKEVIKEVIKIVDRPIEVIKEVPAPSDPDDITINKNSFWAWLSSVLSIFKKKDK